MSFEWIINLSNPFTIERQQRTAHNILKIKIENVCSAHVNMQFVSVSLLHSKSKKKKKKNLQTSQLCKWNKFMHINLISFSKQSKKQNPMFSHSWIFMWVKQRRIEKMKRIKNTDYVRQKIISRKKIKILFCSFFPLTLIHFVQYFV